MGSVPPVDSIRISDHTIPVEIFTEATCEIEMLSSLLPNKRRFTRLTRSGPTTIRVGNQRFPFVQRLAVKVSSAAPETGLAGFKLLPFERALLPNPDVADDQDCEEDQYLNQAVEAERLELHGPGK